MFDELGYGTSNVIVQGFTGSEGTFHSKEMIK